jgi:hypothetical protein
VKSVRLSKFRIVEALEKIRLVRGRTPDRTLQSVVELIDRLPAPSLWRFQLGDLVPKPAAHRLRVFTIRVSNRELLSTLGQRKEATPREVRDPRSEEWRKEESRESEHPYCIGFLPGVGDSPMTFGRRQPIGSIRAWVAPSVISPDHVD